MFRAQHQYKRDGGDRDLPNRSDKEWLDALFQEVLEAGAQTDPGKRKQKCPAAQVAERRNLRASEAVRDKASEMWEGFGIKRAQRGDHGNKQEAEHELRELVPEKGTLVGDPFGLTLPGPVERIAEDDEADAGVAAGLGEDGEFAGGVGIERAGGGGLGGVVDGESGPEAIGVIGHVQHMTDQRKEDERDGSEREDGGDCDRGVFFVGFDGALRGDDGGNAADA